jgi:hypothetical protein
MNDQHDIDKYKRLAENTSKLQYWQGQADRLALVNKMSMAVVKSGSGYQVWSLAKAGNDNVYVSEYKGEEE